MRRNVCQNICFFLILTVMLFSVCACARNMDIPVWENTAMVMTAGTADSTTEPVNWIYDKAVEDFLLPLEDYSWEREYPPEFIMIHFTSAVKENREAPYDETVVRQLFTDYEVSIHYIIDRDGVVKCYIPEDRAAWHAGIGEIPGEEKYTNTMNQYSIGIELMGIGSETDMEMYLPADEYRMLDESLIGFTEAQYQSLSLLVEDLCRRYGIAQDAAHVIGHDAYSAEKTDPGELFDWDRILPDTEE